MPTMLITGGAGFIGTNAALHFARRDWTVAILDDLSRAGARHNLDWLEGQARLGFHKVDVRDAAAVETAVTATRPDVVLHLAAQVAVTTSVADPRLDFEINALGTLNVLEAVRRRRPEAFFINASTNKVYGKLDDLAVVEQHGRYALELAEGVGEDRPLDFHSPYGCSKGVADQYVIDYARVYGLDTVTFRQSCIYGPRQFGIEDQGWLAWFTIAALSDRLITIYGDGKQVRDVLHVDDLVRAYEAAIDRRGEVAGQAFNVGGGPRHTLSLLELLGHLQHELRRNLAVEWADWRPGDQRVYVSNIGKLGRVLGWSPRVGVRDGICSLIDWARANRVLLCGHGCPVTPAHDRRARGASAPAS